MARRVSGNGTGNGEGRGSGDDADIEHLPSFDVQEHRERPRPTRRSASGGSAAGGQGSRHSFSSASRRDDSGKGDYREGGSRKGAARNDRTRGSRRTEATKPSERRVAQDERRLSPAQRQARLHDLQRQRREEAAQDEISNGSSALTLIIMLVVIAIGLFQFLQVFVTYVQNRTQLDAAKEQAAQLQAQKDSLEQEIERWNDRTYVEAQARTRLGFVYEGERPVFLVNTGRDGDSDDSNTSQTVSEPTVPWYRQMMYSLEKSDGFVPDSTDDSTIGDALGSQEESGDVQDGATQDDTAQDGSAQDGATQESSSGSADSDSGTTSESEDSSSASNGPSSTESAD